MSDQSSENILNRSNYLPKQFKNRRNTILMEGLKYNPCKCTVVLVPAVVLSLMITSRKYHFLLSGIPLTITSFIYHNNLIQNFIKYDIMVSVNAYLHTAIYFAYQSYQSHQYIILLPGLLYIIDKIFEIYNHITISNYIHALMHLSIIPGVYMNTT